MNSVSEINREIYWTASITTTGRGADTEDRFAYEGTGPWTLNANDAQRFYTRGEARRAAERLVKSTSVMDSVLSARVTLVKTEKQDHAVSTIAA